MKSLQSWVDGLSGQHWLQSGRLPGHAVWKTVQHWPRYHAGLFGDSISHNVFTSFILFIFCWKALKYFPMMHRSPAIIHHDDMFNFILRCHIFDKALFFFWQEAVSETKDNINKANKEKPESDNTGNCCMFLYKSVLFVCPHCALFTSVLVPSFR